MPVLLNHKRLCSEMEAQDLKQEPLAEQLGISDRHLRNLRARDTNVSASLLYGLSQALQVPMDDLIIHQEEQE